MSNLTILGSVIAAGILSYVFLDASGWLRNAPLKILGVLAGGLVLLVFAGCERGSAEGDRAALIQACDTQKGAGWLRKEYGEDYCACRADKAREALDSETYRQLVKASKAELKAADKAERETIARDSFKAYAQAADAARSACKKKR